MTPAVIIREARAEGLELSISSSGGIRYIGSESAATRWLPIIRQNKPGIVAALQEPANEPEASAMRSATEEEAAELGRLVRACGTVYAFTEEEHREALQIALADSENALACFRMMAAKLGF